MTGTAWLIEGSRFIPLTGGWDPLTWHRTDEAWTWQLVDRATGRHVGELDGVEDGQLTFNVNAQTRGTGSLTWSGWLDDMPDWRNTRVQPTYTTTLAGGARITWPMGVYMCASPSITATSTIPGAFGLVEARVSLYDLTLPLRRAKLSNYSGVNAGRNVVDHVRLLLDTQAPSVQHAIEDNDAVLRSPMTWDPDTPWLTVINALLDAAGMFGLWADEMGRLRSSAYVRPQDRPEIWSFTEGTTAVHEETITHDRDDFEVPNRVTAISRADEDVPALRKVVRLDDYDPTHPHSFAVTGEWVDRVETDVEAADIDVLTQRAERWLQAGLSVASTVTLTHAPIPLTPLDRVSVSSAGIEVPAGTVQTIEIPCTPGEDWTTTIREVATP